MVKIITISIITMLVLATSCKNQGIKNSEHYIIIDKQVELKRDEKDKCNCEIFSLDTSFTNGDYIKCVDSNNLCKYYAKIKDFVKEICDTNFLNNPYVFGHIDDNSIEIVDGNSSGGRYFIILELLNDSMYVNQFHTYVPYNSSEDVFVFKKVRDHTFLFVKEHINLGKGQMPEKKFRLPFKLQSLKIETSSVSKDGIHVKFEKSDNELKIPFKAFK